MFGSHHLGWRVFLKYSFISTPPALAHSSTAAAGREREVINHEFS
jgi:hypothetical protein